VRRFTVVNATSLLPGETFTYRFPIIQTERIGTARRIAGADRDVRKYGLKREPGSKN
jgi:hypothetical protein